MSATVGMNNTGTIATTCGTEADRSENATLIQKISADLLSCTGTQSQFNTLRKSYVTLHLIFCKRLFTHKVEKSSISIIMTL